MVAAPGMIDAILVLVGLEFFGLGALLLRRGASRSLLPLGLFLASGASLLAALRFALAGVVGGLIPALLLLAFAAHAGLLLWAARAGLGRGPDASPDAGHDGAPRRNPRREGREG